MIVAREAFKDVGNFGCGCQARQVAKSLLICVRLSDAQSCMLFNFKLRACDSVIPCDETDLQEMIDAMFYILYSAV